ncbi:MAG: hypothetical protein IJ111_13360 [Eggerthellaceae bacterium]|nr:hypothetical protein [Eggerthellaceae bacterium]
MICPSCGQEVPELKFCVNCGSSLADAATQDFAAQSTEPVNEPATEPSFTPEVPGDSAWQAQPQQAYQTGQTLQMPPQADQFGQQAGGYVPPTGSPQPPTYQVPQAASANRAPNAAFVLVIVGLVLSCLFVTFIPGLVCSIIGLVLNAGYNKKGLDNPRKTATTVVGIIGIVIGVFCLAATIMIGVISAEVVDELDRQGIDITTDSVEVTTDSSGHVNISVKDDKSSSAASGAAVTGSSSAASSSGSTSALSMAKYDEDKYHDSEYNPTLYSVIELTGSELQDLLDFYNFSWDDDIASWYASDGSLYGVEDSKDALTKSQIEQLPAGAAGQPVAIVLTVEGYSTPSAAFTALSKDVTVESTLDVDDVYFAVVHGTPGAQYLVAVSETDDDEQTFLLFTNEAISGGLFEQLTGANAGSSIDEVWKAINSI